MSVPSEIRAAGRRTIFNLGVRLHPADLAGWHSLNLVPMGEHGETASVWERGAARVRVSVAELGDERAARERLAATSEHVMRPDLPSGDELGLALGDANRAVLDPAGVGGAVWFVRGNCWVSVNRANDVPADAFEVAAAIDNDLAEGPRGETRSVELTGGDPVVIATLTEFPGRRVHLEAPGGSFTVDGDLLVYHPEPAGYAHAAARPTEITITVGD